MILGEDNFTSYEKILKFTNEKIAHYDPSKSPKICYDDIEGLSLKIEKIICQEIPLNICNFTEKYPHDDVKQHIKSYLTNIYLKNP